MRRLLAILALVAAFLPASPALGAPADPELDRFVYSAVLDGLHELGLPDATVDRILENDSEGRPVSFIPGCPICTPARNAFLAWRARPAVADRPPATASPELLARLASDKALERTSALGRLVQDLVTRRIAAARWTDAEAEAWGRRFQAATAEGQRQLTAHQAQDVPAYKMMWSCMMCDGAARACKRS